jgi:ligand-binding SRPBCC domain-containing protein
MSTFSHALTLAAKAEEVFEFLRVPKHRLQLMPPEWPLELIEGPALLDMGTKATWKVTRFGMSQILVYEVTVCEPPHRLVEEQRQGPFRRWVQSTSCRQVREGAFLQDEIDYERPGGMLGLLLTQAKIEESLAKTFEWRDRQLRMVFEK